MNVSDDGVTVQAAGGRILMKRVRPEGGGKQSAAEWAAGSASRPASHWETRVNAHSPTFTSSTARSKTCGSRTVSAFAPKGRDVSGLGDERWRVRRHPDIAVPEGARLGSRRPSRWHCSPDQQAASSEGDTAPARRDSSLEGASRRRSTAAITRRQVIHPAIQGRRSGGSRTWSRSHRQQICVARSIGKSSPKSDSCRLLPRSINAVTVGRIGLSIRGRDS